jgi:capsid protein
MIVHGIEINSYGEPVNFYIEGQEKPISASRMGINYYPLETEMYIGVPWMAQSLEHVWDNQQIFSDKMKQSRIGARLGYKFPKSIRDEMDVATESVTDDGDDFFAMEFQGGLFSDQEIQPIKLDDTLKESFLPLVRHNLIALGAGIGFSYQTLTCDLEGMNFAASRANIINDNRFFRALYKWYTKTVLQRRWEKFVEWEILQGKVPGVTYQNFLDDPWYYTQCYWLPMDGEDWVDPLKDAEALKLLYGLGQVTYQEICAMSGKDYRSTYAQLVKERDMFKADGMDHLMPQIKAAAPAAQAVADPNNQDGGDGQ